MDPRILAALSSQRQNAAQMAFAQAQAQNEAAEQVTEPAPSAAACFQRHKPLLPSVLSPVNDLAANTCRSQSTPPSPGYWPFVHSSAVRKPLQQPTRQVHWSPEP